MYRIPSMIEEVDEQDDNLTISNKNSMVEAGSDPKKKENQGEDEEEKDFDFEVPDRLKPNERDGTTMKKKKNEVVDVLA